MLLTLPQLICIVLALAAALVSAARGPTTADALLGLGGLILSIWWLRLDGLALPLVGDVWSLPLAVASGVWLLVHSPVARRWLIVAMIGAPRSKGAPERSTMARSNLFRRPSEPRPAPSAPATGATTVLKPLSRRAWLDRVRQPTYPHRALTGGTRLGKTTMETALLTYEPNARLVVCTPKAEWEDAWAGAPVVRPVERDGDPDWGPVAHATAAVYQEMNARRFSRGVQTVEPIRLVIDEATEAIDEIPALKQQLIRLLKTGASVGIGVTLIDPELNVRAYGIEGRSDILASMLVLSVNDDRQWSMTRGGSKGRTIELLADTDMRGVASAADLSDRGWEIPPYVPPPSGSSTLDSSQTPADEGKGRSAPEELIEFLYTTKGLRDRDAMRRHLRKEYNFGLDNNKFTAVKRHIEGGA